MEIFGHYQRTRLLLAISVVACFLIFWWTGGTFGIPPHRHLEVSLLASPPGAISLLVVVVVVLVCTLLGSLISGTVRFEAGLFAACCGLSALSMRGGTMGDLLRDRAGAVDARPGVFWLLILEAILLFAILGLAWWLLRFMGQRRLLKQNALRDGIEDVVHPLQDRVTAAVAQVAVMSLMLAVLMQSDDKKQVLICIGLSAFVGAIVAYSIFPVQPSYWFWGGSLVVGIVGYVLAYFSHSPWQIGQLNQPLARGLPLDYASAGPAGALLGYWMARKMQSPVDVQDQSGEEPGGQAEKPTGGAVDAAPRAPQGHARSQDHGLSRKLAAGGVR